MDVPLDASLLLHKTQCPFSHSHRELSRHPFSVHSILVNFPVTLCANEIIWRVEAKGVSYPNRPRYLRNLHALFRDADGGSEAGCSRESLVIILFQKGRCYVLTEKSCIAAKKPFWGLVAARYVLITIPRNYIVDAVVLLL